MTHPGNWASIIYKFRSCRKILSFAWDETHPFPFLYKDKSSIDWHTHKSPQWPASTKPVWEDRCRPCETGYNNTSDGVMTTLKFYNQRGAFLCPSFLVNISFLIRKLPVALLPVALHLYILLCHCPGNSCQFFFIPLCIFCASVFHRFNATPHCKPSSCVDHFLCHNIHYHS